MRLRASSLHGKRNRFGQSMIQHEIQTGSPDPAARRKELRPSGLPVLALALSLSLLALAEWRNPPPGRNESHSQPASRQLKEI